MVEILETGPEYIVAGGPSSDERVEKREAARAVLEAAGHDEGLSLYWWTVGHEAWFGCRAQETASACERALAHAEQAGSKRRVRDAALWMSGSCVFGPLPVREAIERVEEVRLRWGGSVLSDAHLSVFVGMLTAMQGDVATARPLIHGGVETIREAGLAVAAAGMSMGVSQVEYWAGDVAAAEQVLRSNLQVLEQLGDRGYHPTVALQLAEILYQAGRFEDVETLCAKGRALTTPEDLINFVYLDMIESGMAARRGQHGEAEELARRAVARAETTDFYWARGSSRTRLAEVLALAGRSAEASEAAASGLGHYDTKGDISGAAVARTRLAALGIELP
jgi:hypothetical protein